MAEADDDSGCTVDVSRLSVGDGVVIRGTGRYWAGINYSATVVDVREEDNTIKVRYADGGYKRFARAQFEELVVKCDDDDDHYRFRAYEMVDEMYDPTAQVLDRVGSMRKQVEEAVARKDFLEAHRLKAEIQQQIARAEELKALKLELARCIQQEDFQGAHDVNVKVEALEKTVRGEQDTGLAELDISQVMSKALKRAAGGGAAGAIAMILQVSSLMWMRTTMNYQYRYGTTTRQALSALYSQGGVRRFYRGIGPALFQGPLSRFGDTAANTGVLALLNAFPATADLPVGVKTLCASGAAVSWRIMLMPIDTVKTTLQVEGKDALTKLRAKAKAHGPKVYYHGALAASAATFAGHFPWFFTFNFLDEHLPKQESTLGKLGRNALMGFCSSAVSDTVSNSIRVVKTYRQTNTEMVSYPQAVKNIVESDGVLGLFGRGVRLRAGRGVGGDARSQREPIVGTCVPQCQTTAIIS